MKALVVAGARPNFMKVAPVLRALAAGGHDAVLVHTGQHYDAAMSDDIFRDLGLPAPDYHLGVGGGSHAQQTGRIMEQFEPVLLRERPDWVVVVGDVNSTLACALVAAKLKGETGCRIAHVEAGLRSHDWRMPEEINRVLTDRLSDLLLMPSRDALENLIREGLDPARAVMVGNVMIDSLLAQLPAARALGAAGRRGLTPGAFAAVTLHRPSNVDDPASLGRILEGLAGVAQRLPVVFPMHPRTRRTVESAGLEIPRGVSGGGPGLLPGDARAAGRCRRGADGQRRDPGGDHRTRRPLRHPARTDRAPGHGYRGDQPTRALAPHGIGHHRVVR